MVTATGLEAMPFATASSLLAPVSMPAGTSKCVDTVALPVADRHPCCGHASRA